MTLIFRPRLAVIQHWKHVPKDPFLFEDPSDFEIWCDGAMPPLLDERMAAQIATRLNQKNGGTYRVWLAPIL